MIKSLLKKLWFYFKISWCFCLGKKISAKHYADDYSKVSKTYDDLWIKKMGKHTKEMIDKVEFQKGYSLLDLGCGTGEIIRLALKKGEPKSILGIDISPGMLKNAKKQIHHKHVRFLQKDFFEYMKEIPDASYDIVTCGWALAYGNKKSAIKEIARILKPNGQVAIIVNRKGTLSNIHQAYLKLMQQYPEKIDLINDIQFRLPKNAEALQALLTREKLSVIDVYDQEESFDFQNGKEVLYWLNNSGAFAGTFSIFKDSKYLDALASIIEKESQKKGVISVTHKFSVCIGQKI